MEDKVLLKNGKKWWECSAYQAWSGRTLMATVIQKRWGVTGGKSQTKNTSFKDEKKARTYFNTQVRKKMEQGYSESGNIKDSKVGGGVWPMLAKTASKRDVTNNNADYVQPKLDGVRCIAVKKGGEWKLWSRKRKPLHQFKNIIAALDATTLPDGTILDGELYNHAYCHCFDELSGHIRAGREHKDIQYHVYDAAMTTLGKDAEFSRRYLDEACHAIAAIPSGHRTYLRRVKTYRITDHNTNNIKDLFESFVEEGYEGAMLRMDDAPYFSDPLKRSPSLKKYKHFETTEFEIADIIPFDRDPTQGRIVFKVGKNKTGKALLKASHARRRELLKNKKDYIGLPVTIRHQGFGADGRPRIPVAVAIRDYE